MKRRTVFVALAVIAILAVTLGVAQAQLKLTGVLHAWDDKTNRWENGNAQIWLPKPGDESWEPLWQKLDFDSKTLVDNPASGCTKTLYAGQAQIGMGYIDNNPANGKGFQQTRDWALVDCGLLFDAKGKSLLPASFLATCGDNDPNCKLTPVNNTNNKIDPGITADYIVPCANKQNDTSNCAKEIDTQFIVNMSTCDGKLDPKFAPAGGVCLYWEAKKPPMEKVFWGGNIQGRVSIGGGAGFTGDKTINFSVFGPNAVGLGKFTASSAAVPVAAVAGLLVLVGAAVIVLPRRRR